MTQKVKDPYLIPAFTFRNKFLRVVWWLFYVTLFKFSPKPMFLWRRYLLMIFGAKIGRKTAIYPRARIWAPWKLECGEMVAIANDVEIYNPEKIKLGSHAIVSQGAFLCGASHDYNSPDFRLISLPISLGAYSWICSRSIVQMGVDVGEGAILAAGSVATKNLDPWVIYGGTPARPIKKRNNVIKETGV